MAFYCFKFFRHNQGDYKLLNLITLFFLLFSAWIMLSGIFTVQYLIIGALSSLLALVFCHLIYKDKISGLFFIVVRMAGYLLWLFKEIAKSSFDLSLKMWQLEPEISPQVLWIPVNLRDDVAVAVFANSITLTPGTVTIGTRDGMIYVHSLTEEITNDLKRGVMLDKVYRATKLEKK